MNSLDLDEKQLEAIEEMAAHGFSHDEIACTILPTKMLLTEDNFQVYDSIVLLLRSRNTIAGKAYRRGFLRSQLELRQRIFQDAKHGSSPAQALAKNILDAAAFKNDAHE
jgi:hypothetical protein